MIRTLPPALLATLALAAPAPAAEVSFTRDVKPFLAKYCVECHKAEKAHGGVALDSYAALIRGNDPVVHPGKPERSDLVRVLASGAGRKAMPPRDYAAKPKADEIALIRAWVQAGAKDDTGAAPEETEAQPASRNGSGASARRVTAKR
jgi:hypothetical protein